ncbi:hypothetical protein KP509_10G055500 [Ceratopteris richardii]|uniref:T-complex protein 11 n=2 Tax=Ceratopteris richardii TaxID=49495 RepID=A0A8T2U214_CERRI|nr:hypothetical protein KP509_10G055500 [Ceratopteris richardii]KAH7427694.1 hypothetical protein KP509_10G055500 [Ceratopteris richardii]KAH7427695.1 hypothetical protein KP509_10G055500 [Ceratopteris richardii]
MATSPSMNIPGSQGEDILRSPGIAFDVEISDVAMSPPSSVPKRVRRRLLETPEGRSRSPSSLQEIQAKLKEADLRRQQFHEWLANKARPKVKSPPRSLQSVDLAERLQTKLVAAEQKRLELLSQEQTRLARLEELRAAARTGVQLRAEREREELESRVESRVQQAEVNRLALLEAEKQRRALVHERAAQSLLLRTTLEGKDRERIEVLRALICKKIAAADAKRENLLKAERIRAQAVVLQARKVAKAVRRKRELESRNKKELLEARLQKAKRLRAEYLGQRGGCQGACHNNGHKMKKHGDRLCRKLTRCWRQFRRSRRTTLMLTQDFVACNISQKTIQSLPFEELAGRITSATTLRSVKSLLARIESRFKLSSASNSNVANIDHLLKRLAPPRRRGATRSGQGMIRSPGSGAGKDTGEMHRNSPTRKAASSQKPEVKEMERYPARVFLCAYMIIGHPEAVFSSRGEREVALSEAAQKLVPEFEKLITIIIDGPPSTSLTRPSSPSSDDQKKGSLSGEGSGSKPFSAQLADFDAAWCSYLYHFVAWKVEDAHLLEEDLIRVACQLELSMLQKCNGVDATHDSKAIQKQVLEDQKLLRERILRLTGTEGVSKLENALVDARNQCVEAWEKGNPLPSPFASPQRAKISAPTSLVSSDQFSLEPKELFPRESSISTEDEKKSLDNERLVNEMLHEPIWNLASAVIHGEKKSEQDTFSKLQAQVKQIMEDAFWDGVVEGLEKDPPDYKRIVGLMEELKGELVSIAPDAWKQELNESLDVEIFSQVVSSGNYDYDYFHKLLDYALSIVLKLGAPARDEDAKLSYQALVKELFQISSEQGDKNQKSFALALVKGLRFVLEQVQVLKADISAARIQALKPILQGSAGFDYLQKAFSKRYSLSEDSRENCRGQLLRTSQWLAEVDLVVAQSKEDIEASRTAFWATASGNRSASGLPPTLSMRTGGRVIAGPSSSTPMDSFRKPEEPCVLKWDSFETRVKLGLVKIISGIQPVTEDNIPETFNLNVHRLRKAQNEYQRLVILVTGLLLLRQNAVGKGLTGESLDEFLKMGKDRLDVILEDPMVSISKIGETLSELTLSLDPSMESNGELMSRVLSRSLSPDDAVFKKVSSVVQSALKASVLLGSAVEGSALVMAVLQRVGAKHLEGLIVNLGSSLERLANISCLVHGPWYASLVNCLT